MSAVRPAIRLRGIVKRHGAITAVDGLDLEHAAVLIAFALVMWRLAVWRLELRLID